MHTDIYYEKKIEKCFFEVRRICLLVNIPLCSIMSNVKSADVLELVIIGLLEQMSEIKL